MKVKPTMTFAEFERNVAKMGGRIAPPGHPIYSEPPSMTFLPGKLVPGIVSDALAAPEPAVAEPTSTPRDPLAPPLRSEYWDDESYEEAQGYWNTHIGRVLALRRQYMTPKQDQLPADPGQYHVHVGRHRFA